MGTPLRVLVTGALGNIGSNTVPVLLERGHRVRALDVKPMPDELRRSLGRAEVVRADVRDRAAMDAAVRDVDVVVHLAYLIPPPAWDQPAQAEAVNVGGTNTLLDAAKAAATPPRFLFASSLDVYGRTTHLPPPRRVTDPLEATDNYSGHKIANEARVRESGLTWCIFRFADVPPIALRDPVPAMFNIPLTTRIETLHPRDAGLAIANALDAPEAWGHTWNVGGGARCQLTYRQYLGGFLEAMGIGALPDDAFSTEPYCTDWLDTEASQKLLRYQRHGFDDIVRETAALLGWKGPLAKLAAPLVRRKMLSLSPRWRGRV
jgi:nucleoside-diphosphate-sugar epimerase